MEDAKLSTKDIDASLICSAPEYDKQRSPAGVFAEYLGLIPHPTCYVESLCSSSSMGLRLAYSLIKAGLHDEYYEELRHTLILLQSHRRGWAGVLIYNGKALLGP